MIILIILIIYTLNIVWSNYPMESSIIDHIIQYMWEVAFYY